MTYHQAGPNDQWQSTDPAALYALPQEQRGFSPYKVVIIIAAVLAVVGLVVGVATVVLVISNGVRDDTVAVGPGTTETGKTSQPKPAAEDRNAGMGDTVRDGNFEFVVTKVEEGGTRIGDKYFNEQAQGVFQFVHVRVTNVGDEPQMMVDSNQMLQDQEGRQFAPDSKAAILLEDKAVWIEEINPGNTFEGMLVYDMPADSKPTAIELHDSMMSGGVTVSLK